MIIIHLDAVNEISQELYEKMIEEIDFLLLTCPHCNHAGMKVHAYYERIVRSNGESFKLLVIRVKCSSCGKTHAILPDTLVPYSSITLKDTVDIIQADSPAQLDMILSRNPLLDLTELYRIKSNYRKFWKERLISFGISIDNSISRMCIQLFGRQFMQIPCTLCGEYW